MRASLHDLRALGNSSVLASSSSVSTNASECGSTGYFVDLRSSGNNSRAQVQSTALSGSSSASVQCQLLHSVEACTLEQNNGEEATETLVEAASALALKHVLGKRSAAPLSPAESTSSNDSPNAPTSSCTSVAADQASAAVVAVTATVAASLLKSPPHNDRHLQDTPAAGPRVAGVSTYRVAEERSQRGHILAFQYPQPEFQVQSQPPTSLRESAEDQRPTTTQPSRLSPTVDDSTDEKRQGSSSTSNVTVTLAGGGESARQVKQPMAAPATKEESKAEKDWRQRRAISETSICSMAMAATEMKEEKAEDACRERGVISEIPTSSTKNAFLANAAAEERGTQPATMDATVRSHPNLAGVVRNWRSIPGVARKRSTKGVVDRMAAVVAEAKEKRRKGRGRLVDENTSVSDAGNGTSLGTSRVRTGLMLGLPVGKRSSNMSYRSAGETDAEADMRMHVEAVHEVWERVMQETATDEFGIKAVEPRIVTPTRGMSTSSE